MELKLAREAEALRRKKKKADLLAQIFVVTATYRKTQAELNGLIVEVLCKYTILCYRSVIPTISSYCVSYNSA